MSLIRDVITHETTADEWAALRERMHQRVSFSMGGAPEEMTPVVCLGDRTNTTDGPVATLEISIAGQVLQGHVLFPSHGQPAPLVLCCHGTDYVRSHHNQFSPDEVPNRAYASELRARGYVTAAVDLYGYGHGDRLTSETIMSTFTSNYPMWSLDGVRVATHRAVIDTLLTLGEVDSNPGVGAIGNSLGGRSVLYLAAMDQRLSMSIASTGVSPNYSNVFRNRPSPLSLSPRLDEACQSGTPPWDYHELLALIAPRGLVLLEPWNDPFNPHIEPVLECFTSARRVWKLLQAESRLQIVCHGHGHDTPAAMRSYAYAELTEVLGAPRTVPHNTGAASGPVGVSSSASLTLTSSH